MPKKVRCLDPVGPCDERAPLPDVIWLGLHKAEQCWCDDPIAEIGCIECGARPVPYIRADLALEGRRTVEILLRARRENPDVLRDRLEDC